MSNSFSVQSFGHIHFGIKRSSDSITNIKFATDIFDSREVLEKNAAKAVISLQILWKYCARNTCFVLKVIVFNVFKTNQYNNREFNCR